MIEVGATNKVRLDDYARALSPRTALLLRAHASNYRIEGFTAEVGGAALVELGRRAGVPVVEDLGSGALADLRAYGLPHERTVQEAVAEGIDLIAFSADKLLGGPQAGIVVGRAALVKRLRANPLLRALRVGSATIAALGATLRLHLDPAARDARIPFYRMLAASRESLRARGEALRARLDGCDVELVDADGYAGGGTLPLAAVRIRRAGVAAAARRRERRCRALAPRLAAGRRAGRGRAGAARPAHGSGRTGRGARSGARSAQR